MLQEDQVSVKNDKMGIIASLACSVHCLLPPLLISFGGFSDLEILHHPLVHILFLGSALYFAWKAFGDNLKKHRNWSLAVLAILGFVLVFTGILFGSSLEFLLVGIGGIVIAAAHFGNLRLAHRHRAIAS